MSSVPWPGVKSNQAMQLSNWLVGEHGFEIVRDGANRVEHLRMIDDEHAMWASAGPTDFEQRGDHPQNWSLLFGLARRDINEHLMRWRPDIGFGPEWHFPTVLEGLSDHYLSETRLYFGHEVLFEGQAELGEAVERVVGKATLEGVEAALYLPKYRLQRGCLLYTSPSPRDATLSRMPSSA